MVNMAYQVLRDPLSRANYLLAQHGISAEGDDRTISDPKFLMEVMEAREEVEETEDEEALRELLAANRERQQQVRFDSEPGLCVSRMEEEGGTYQFG